MMTRVIDDVVLEFRCCGCGACADACAAKAIAFVEDADGFARPQVDAARCRSCGSCTRACPALRADHAVPVANGTRESGTPSKTRLN